MRRMAAFIALLRGINVGKTRRMAMPRLREVLEDAGFEDVRTYVQSGNVVVHDKGSAAQVRERIERAIRDEWGFEVPVIVRTRAQLQKVHQANPLAKVATEPKHYQVTFLDAKPTASAFEGLDDSGWGDARFELVGSELYTWTPAGIHSDRMLRDLARAHKGIHGTARNWRTVEALLELASD
jgi:uncharacterized protein (DUF1697 family)